MDRIRGIKLGLREIGVVIPKELIVSTILLGLGNRFRTLVIIIIYSKLLIPDKLCAILLNKEVKARGVEGLSREGAYLARSSIVY